jgi:signal transduction histidine kinase/ligand-binding sensor domain-containing protein
MNWLSTSSTTCHEPRESHWRFTCFVLLLAALCPVSIGQELNSNRTIKQFARETWGEKQGYPGDEVTAFAQTADGYLWIGTKKGLIRFDGLEFRVYSRAVPENFQIGAVRALKTDSRGNLWILLEDSQVLRFHNRRFELGREGAEFAVSAIGTRKDGTTLFASLTALGTLTFDGEKFQVLAPQADNLPTRDAMVAVQGDDDLFARFNWATGVAGGRVASSAVVAIAETSDGKIWRATADHDLSYLFNGRIFQVEEGTLGGRTNCLLPLTDGKMWIGTDRGILRWDGTKLTQLGIPAPLQRAEVHALLQGHDSSIWVGSAKGLFRVKKDGLSYDAHSGAIKALFEDREGNVWVGTSGSIERLRESLFVTYPVGGHGSESSGPIYVDDDGRTWFAPLEGSLHWLRGTETGTIANDSLSKDVVYSIAGQKDEVWIGRQRGGLTRLLYSPKAITTRTYTETDGLAQNSVYAVYESQDGTVWSGTLSGGVSELKEGHFKNYTITDGLASNTVSSIAEGTDGRMWFGTPKGLSELSSKGWRNYGISDGLTSPDINCLSKDSGGVLWIGTAGGLAFLRNGQLQLPQGTQAWLREPILGITEDSNGWLWVATSTSVLRAKRDSLTNGHGLNDSDFRVYGRDDGLGGTGGVKRFRSVLKDAQGSVWFSTNHGVSVVTPDRSIANSLPALLRVESVTVDGNDVNLGQAIRVPPGDRRIVFHYLGLSLANPGRVRYRYWLDGFDRGWSEATSNREAAFANLSPGTYRFRVMCSNSDGSWNDADASIDFAVLPALYQTNWFRVMCAAGLFGFLWGIYQLRVQQLQRQFAIALEARLNERTRIARDLHDTLLQTLHGLMFRFQAARNLFARRPEEALDALDSAIDRTEQAIAESREAIEDLRIEHSTSTDLGELLTATGQELATSIGHNANCPTFQLIVGGDRQYLSPGVQDEVYRIGRELLRNAFQHAHARHIEAEIRYDDHAVTLLVRDDGKGIEPTVIKEGGRAGHWGLPGIRERAKQIQAQLDFWTENRAGTEVQLRVPGSIAYKAVIEKPRFKLFRKEEVS